MFIEVTLRDSRTMLLNTDHIINIIDNEDYRTIINSMGNPTYCSEEITEIIDMIEGREDWEAMPLKMPKTPNPVRPK